MGSRQDRLSLIKPPSPAPTLRKGGPSLILLACSSVKEPGAGGGEDKGHAASSKGQSLIKPHILTRGRDLEEVWRCPFTLQNQFLLLKDSVGLGKWWLETGHPWEQCHSILGMGSAGNRHSSPAGHTPPYRGLRAGTEGRSHQGEDVPPKAVAPNHTRPVFLTVRQKPFTCAHKRSVTGAAAKTCRQAAPLCFCSEGQLCTPGHWYSLGRHSEGPHLGTQCTVHPGQTF